jgi:hypothetical protein
MRTLPSGRRVAVCPERGSSIGAAGVTVPTRDGGEAALLNGTDATAKLIVKLRAIEATNDRRDRFMASSIEKKTCLAVKRKLVTERRL